MRSVAVSLAFFFGLAPAAQAAFEVCNRNFDSVQFVVARDDGGAQESAGWYTLQRDECGTYFNNASSSASFYYRLGGPDTPGIDGTRSFCISDEAFTSLNDPNCTEDGMFPANFLPAAVTATSLGGGKKRSSSSPAPTASFVIPEIEEDVSVRASIMAYRASYATPKYLRASGDWEIFTLERPSGERTCFSIKEFSNGTVLRFGKEPTAPDIWHFQIGNADWTSLEDGTNYELKAKLTSRRTWTLTSVGAAAKLGWPVYLSHRFADDSTFLQDIKNGNTFSIEYKGKRIANPSLRGSTKAVNAVVACMKEFAGNSSGGGSGSSNSDDPFAD